MRKARERKFHGSEITTTYKPCKRTEHPYNDYNEIHSLLTGGITNLRQNSKLIKELRFILKHLDRKSNELIYRKCTDPRCDHCSSNPILSKKSFLKMSDFKWPNPKPSSMHDNHYMTFMEMSNLECDEYLTGNQGLPFNLETGTCPFAEKKKRLSVFHTNYKGDGKKIWEMEHRCLFIIKDKQGSNRCNLLFKSANQLLEHKQKAKHILQRKKRSGETTSSGKKKKQVRLEQVMDVKTTDVFEEEKVDDKNSEVLSESSATCDEDSTMQNVLG